MPDSSTRAHRINFPVSDLVRDAKLLLAALLHATYGPKVLARLTTAKNAKPDTAFSALIARVEQGGTNQSGAKGDLGELTQEGTDAQGNLARLVAGARRSGELAFPGDARLHAEFLVGIHEPHTLSARLDRAKKILAAVTKYADAVAEHGWTAEDTTALTDVIATLSTTDTSQEKAKGKKKGATTTLNSDAAALYHACLGVQNAARLAYPAKKPLDAATIEAHTLYLLATFPPKTSNGTSTTPPAPTPTTPTAAPKPTA